MSEQPDGDDPTVAPLAAHETVQVVDRHNNPLRGVPRWQVRVENLTYRATYIFVFNQAGKLFLQKRSPRKDMYPGYYDPAAGGVVAAGESYDESAKRELQEEMGVTDSRLQAGQEFYFESEDNRIWGRIYRCEHDGPFALQAAEIDDGFFCPVSEIVARRWSPLTPDGLHALLLYTANASPL